jgi:hypothetical protein
MPCITALVFLVIPCSTNVHAGSRAAELMFFYRQWASFSPFAAIFLLFIRHCPISVPIDTRKQDFNIGRGLKVGHTRGHFENAYEYLVAAPTGGFMREGLSVILQAAFGILEEMAYQHGPLDIVGTGLSVVFAEPRGGLSRL